MGRDWLLPLYDPVARLLGTRRMHRLLIGEAGVRPGQRVLEIGCGTGNLLLELARIQPEVTAVGLDPDPRALALAARKTRRAGMAVQLDRGSAAALPYPDGGFDRVLSSLMFHHLSAADRLTALREVRRVLTPGGSLHLLDFGGDGHQHRHGPLARLARRNPHLHDNYGDRIPALMREAGLTDPRQTGQHRGRVGHYAIFVAGNR
jgi:ubiquinone/menaquinone biosynthesis C-methylase UbiE